jgi:cobalamin biosynthesis protein CobT
MTTYRRANAKWTINECLRLEREFDLLKLSIYEIAALHERSAQGIMYKLDSEGLADYNVLAVCGTNYQLRHSDINKDIKEEEEDEDEKDSDDSSDYEEELDGDNDDAASEVSDLEEDEEDKEEYDRFNLRQQINILSKQLANLTAIVYKVLSPKQAANRFNFEDLAGCR